MELLCTLGTICQIWRVCVEFKSLQGKRRNRSKCIRSSMRKTKIPTFKKCKSKEHTWNGDGRWGCWSWGWWPPRGEATEAEEAKTAAEKGSALAALFRFTPFNFIKVSSSFLDFTLIGWMLLKVIVFWTVAEAIINSKHYEGISMLSY